MGGNPDPSVKKAYYVFPSGPEKCKWVQFIHDSGKLGWEPKAHSKLCEIHFSKDDFNHMGRRLRKGAVPKNKIW